jgi:hypothetical protein
MLFSSTQSLIYLHLPSISFISGKTLKPHQPSIKDTKETSCDEAQGRLIGWYHVDVRR